MVIYGGLGFSGLAPVYNATSGLYRDAIKTLEAGNRLIPLDEQLAALLQPCRQINGFIIGDGTEPITETTFKRMWERIGRWINLCGATPHVFRHTYITLAASSGMDVKTLQSIAGHSDIKMTLDRYAHERENNIISAGSLIGGVFRSM